MTTDTITHWLQSPSGLPDEAAVQSLLRDYPWFVPGRLMEAAGRHRRDPFSPESLSLVHLYGTDWVTSYRLLSAVGAAPDSGQQSESGTSAPAASEAGGVDVTMPQPAGAIKKIEASVPPAPAAEEIPQTAAAVPEGGAPENAAGEAPLIQPLFTEDYFRHQGVVVAEEIPKAPRIESEDPKTLMVVMSFAEWLAHFKTKSEREQEEDRDKRALRSMWQQEKLAAALEDEPEEIPEDVFEMAVSSITREDDLASESLAEILEKQGKWSAAAEMYRKLGLRNPAKSTYFASRAEAAKKRAS